MTSLGVPSWLAEATNAATHLGKPELTEAEPADVLPGDLCVIQPYDRREEVGRLFLVVDAHDGWCEGMMASAETELATEVDAILDPVASGLAYDVAVHSRFAGPIWVTQVRRRIGVVTADVLDQLLALQWEDEPAGMSLRLGMPLQPEGIDPRYPALSAMSAELDALTEHYRRCRHDLARPILDPVLAQVDLLRTILTEGGWDERIDVATSSPAFRDQLLEAYPQLTKDEQRAAMPFLERATVRHSSELPTRAAPVVAEHRDPQALSEALYIGARARPVITVLTHRSCWTTRTRSSVRIFAEQGTIVIFEPVSDLDLMEVA
jgi:hypothetical protein